MTDTEIAELEAELRLHKEERLRLRALEMRLSRELAEAKALLAGARAVTQDSLDSNTTGFDEEFKVCSCDSCERYRSIIRRIDAFLAEVKS